MQTSPYFRLDDEDIMQKGDEIRFDTPASSLSQYCDTSLDESRSQWEPVTKHWIGKRFGEFKRRLTPPVSKHYYGKIDCRRRIVP